MLPPEYPLYRSNTAVLQAIVAKVARGYVWWHQGAVEVARALPLVEKLDRAYHVLLHPNHQSIVRRADHPTARLVLADKPQDQGGEARWPFVLLSTQKLPGERMFGVRDPDHPLVWRGIYELYFTAWRRWSWRLCPEHFEELSRQLAGAARGDPGRLIRRLDGLTYYPRFHGVHQDLKRLVYAAQKAWGSSRRGEQHRRGMAQPDWSRYLNLRPLRGVGTGLYERPPVTLGHWLEEHLESP